MARKQRVNFSTAEKAAILKRHFIDKVAVSALCEEYDMHVSTFYDWQKRMFEGQLGEGGGRAASDKALTRKVEALEAKLAHKDAVIAEVTGEYVTLKKNLGEA